MDFDRFSLGDALLGLAGDLKVLRLQLEKFMATDNLDSIHGSIEAIKAAGVRAWDISLQCASLAKRKRSRRKLDDITIDLAVLIEWVDDISSSVESARAAIPGLRRAELTYLRLGKYYSRPERHMDAYQRSSVVTNRDTIIVRNKLERVNFFDSTPISGWRIPKRTTSKIAGTPNLANVSVFYATDRRIKNGTTGAHLQFEDGRGGDLLSYGVADVTIPAAHKIGKLERPSIWKLQFSEDKGKHIVIATCKGMNIEEWNSLVKGRMHKTGKTSALVFVHGYNVSFDDAIRRSAQIGFDLQFDGVISTYSWGSAARLDGYFADEDTVRLSEPLFEQFLMNLHRNVGVQTIHIIAHSMGNRLVVGAIANMPNVISPILTEVVMAAPDIDASLFRAAISGLSGKAARYTLYGSKNDKALVTSKRLRQGFPRAGDGGANVVVVNGVETVDASAVGDDLFGLGHGYFASKRTVLTDLAYLIRDSLSASRRHGLREETTSDGLTYWLFQP